MSGMVVPVRQDTLISADSSLHRAIRVEVSGGEETNPLWISKVSNRAFLDALENTLELHTLLAEDATPGFTLMAELVALEQPWAGLDMTVLATVRYTLTELPGDTVVLDEEVRTSHTTEFLETLNATERIRLATEGAMQTSIAKFLQMLLAAFAPREEQQPGGRR